MDYPPTYTLITTTKLPGMEKHTYQMKSQAWVSGLHVEPEIWTHAVDIYVPAHAYKERAILIINNGINNGTENSPVKAPTDFSENTLRSVAEKTQTIVVSVNNAPNQLLIYSDDPVPKKEDDSIAHSWKLFLASPEEHLFSSVHIPTMEVAIKAMNLAEAELQQWNIHGFIVAGISKRGWAAWHVAVTDKRVEAIVPFVFDGLNTKKMLDHTYQVYGGNWPLALQAYVNSGVVQKRDSPEFAKLMEIEDPLNYKNSKRADRLSISKYLVNASGDDFFVPDNAKLYFQSLPGNKALRVAPNSSHYDIKDYVESSLVPFINRIQKSMALPLIATELTDEEPGVLSVHFSEPPVLVTKWEAINPASRDFRYVCGIRYVPTAISLDENTKLHMPLKNPAQGWQAMFVEAKFSDGFIATTRVYVSPDAIYPEASPPSYEPYCKTVR